MDNSNVIFKPCSFLFHSEVSTGGNVPRGRNTNKREGILKKGVTGMCYATKRKIADCVKRLMRRQDISKITIQDVMDETGMSRQSFYYHFKDIYDVLEWIVQKDFKEPISDTEYESMEDWVCDLFRMIDKERSFYEKIVSEVEWPRIIRNIKVSLKEQMMEIFALDESHAKRCQTEEWNSCMDIFSTSFGYYILDYIYRRKGFSEKKVIQDTRYIMMMLENIQENTKSSIVVFPRTMVM